MQWIEGISRQNGRLVASAVTQSGDRHVGPLADMQPPPKEYATHRHKISTDFGSWTEASSEEYLTGLAFTTEVHEGHRIFALAQGGVRYLVPALVLMKAFFRPLPRLSKYLFSPQGLSQTTIFQMDGSKPFIRELSSLKVEPKYNTALQTFSWYWAFPSAYECWHSVYVHAAEGELAMNLPKGNMICVAHGVLKDSVFHVISLTVQNIDTGEKPFDFAAGHPRIIRFHDRANKVTRHISQDNQIVKRDGDWTLSDTEWEAVKSLIAQGKRSNFTHDMRKIVDLVVEKIGSGTAWRNSSKGAVSWNAAQRHYRKWTVDGRWEHIRNTLFQLRASQSEAAARQSAAASNP